LIVFLQALAAYRRPHSSLHSITAAPKIPPSTPYQARMRWYPEDTHQSEISEKYLYYADDNTRNVFHQALDQTVKISYKSVEIRYVKR
jgi:hypothetical protein